MTGTQRQRNRKQKYNCIEESKEKAVKPRLSQSEDSYTTTQRGSEECNKNQKATTNRVPLCVVKKQTHKELEVGNGSI